MLSYRSLWPWGLSACPSFGGGLVLMMSIMGCAHLAKSPPQTATPGASHPAGGGSAQANSAPGASAQHDQTSGAGTSSKNEAGNPPAAQARSNTGGTKKIPSRVKGGSDKGGQPPAAAPPTLGLSDLEQRLRDTHAIGVFTKLSLRNQIDDLLDQVRAYHLKPTVAALPELRHRYDELLQKVIGLLQSGDPSLAKDISSSREAIWSLLTQSTTIGQLALGRRKLP
jgi:hypothetical protein